ncbi:type III secretion system outer membrane ring subunit SctC [Variovorax sp. KK3]|uniref:type III secretion system outer membrane ring subunit SctC n=1 Tax=Variovorax sp. KK3 TaxID=1855728 RepID=UPI00097C7182|nr:type III secretion system outer membrane ring subunit SctC [Variovorax sp. KK3]
MLFRNNFFSSLLPITAVILHLLCATSASAAPSPWPASSFSYVAAQERLTGVLNEFGRIFGIRVQLTQGITDQSMPVNGTITTATPDEFLNRLAASHGLQWFQHGGTLYVSRATEAVTRALPSAGGPNLRKALIDLGVVDDRFGWAELPDRAGVVLVGPPAYVELVASTLAALPPSPAELEVRVFRLRHAAVDDRIIQYRDKQITTFGVASMLRSLLSNSGGRTGTVMQFAPPPPPISPMAGAAGIAKEDSSETATKASNGASTRPASRDDTARTGASSDTAGGSVLDNSGRPVVQADSRLNAVIIRDRPNRMQMYEGLIASLDVPSYLVEIEAMIIDVNKTKVAQLGVDWQARFGNTTAGFGLPDAAADSTTAVISLASGGNLLKARIHALESSGDARVVSRPSVVTVDNLGALIDLSQTLYLSAIGERVANVVPVSVGISLKVTPHVIEQGGKRAVELTVDIEDGGVGELQVQGLPTVRRSSVSTQGVMAENESLLVGGFQSESESQKHDRIPVLGDLPVVGSLFGKKDTNNERRERMFVLTPRVIVPATFQARLP